MRSITQAVHEKYNDDDDDSCASGFVLFVPRSSPRQRLPSTLILDHCDINSVGDEEFLTSQCQDVKELDLAYNRISRWDEVNKLISCLPKLSFLNLSFNTLGQGNFSIPPSSYPSLKKLVLNRVGVQWNDLIPYLCLIPNLEELHLSFNQMDIPSRKEDAVFPKVTTLHFDGNRIEHKDHLRWLSRTFPSLNCLVVCDCPLWTLRWRAAANTTSPQSYRLSDGSSGSYSSSSGETCDFASPSCLGDGKTSTCCRVPPYDECNDWCHDREASLFPHLRTVSLNNSMFECWADLDDLRDWPSLVELRLQTCPLFRKLTEHERRQLTIARLPNLRRLNGGGDIGAKEREEAERNFIRRFHDHDVKPARYRELLNVHGHVAPFAEVSLSPPKVANVCIRYEDRRWNERVSLFLTLKELKERLGATVGLRASKIRLWHYDQSQPMDMRFPSKRLYSYNVKDGDEFLIDEKP